jgi:hypothetical protein
MDTVHLLWYVREWAEGDDTELLIGVYRTEADAKDAIGRLKNQPGFVEYPEGFTVATYDLGKDYWTKGFARMLGERNITKNSR